MLKVEEIIDFKIVPDEEVTIAATGQVKRQPVPKFFCMVKRDDDSSTRHEILNILEIIAANNIHSKENRTTLQDLFAKTNSGDKNTNNWMAKYKVFF